MCTQPRDAKPKACGLNRPPVDLDRRGVMACEQLLTRET